MGESESSMDGLQASSGLDRPPPLLPQQQQQQQHKRRRKLVAVTFSTSLASFFVAVCYDYARPTILRRVLRAFEAATSGSCGSLESRVAGASTPSLAPVVVEIFILVPLLLIALPLTQAFGKRCWSTEGSRRVSGTSSSHGGSSPTTVGDKSPPWRLGGGRTKEPRQLSGGKQHHRFAYLLTVLRILRAVAWVLWTVSAVVLLTGVLYGAKFFGLISVSALLALFAQGVGAVGFLAPAPIFEGQDRPNSPHERRVNEGDVTTAAEEQSAVATGTDGGQSPDVGEDAKEDDIWRESSVVERDEGITMVADDWIRRISATARPKVGGDDTNDDNPTAPDNTCDTSVGHKNSSEPSEEAIPSGRKLDVVIFFLVNTALLQSPHYLHVGFHFLINCVNCRWNSENFGDAPGEPNSLGGLWSLSGAVAAIPVEIPALMALFSTVMTPLLTHGVGGEIFCNGWSFHHPFRGGRDHVKAQATGWSLLCMAALLHLSFLALGMAPQYVYLMHSGSVISWCAQAVLLYSLLIFRPQSDKKDPTSATTKKKAGGRTVTWVLLSVVQDLVLTNMHWFFLLWLTSATLGFNAFSLEPMEKVFNLSWTEAVTNTLLLLVVWTAAIYFIPYSARRKRWRWNPFGLLNDSFERFLFHPNGLFHDSRLVHDDGTDVGEYLRGGAMFALAPHGTLPTNVWAVWHQFEHVFGDVCLFFGSQVALVPGYRYIAAMRGGLLPVEKKNLVAVMETGQSVALVPGGVSEMLHCVPHDRRIRVSVKHKGFVRLAIQEGYDLVPTFFFHANDAYDNPMRDLQVLTYQRTGVPIGLPWFTNRWRLPLSNRKPIRVALGRRIPVEKNPKPSEREVDDLHRLFYEEVFRVWDKHKVAFGYGERELSYVT